MSPSSSSFVGSGRERIEALTQQLQASEEKRLTSESKLAYAECRIQLLEEALRAGRINKYGPKSDRLTSNQLEFLEAEPGSAAPKPSRKLNVHRWKRSRRRIGRGARRILVDRLCRRTFRGWSR